MERPPGRDRHDLADSRPGARRDHTGQQQARNRAEQPGPPCSLKATSTTRATPTTGAAGGDPHGRQPAEARRRRPAAGPGATQPTGPGHTATGKEENHQDKHSDHGDQGHQQPGRRIEAPQLPEDHPAGSRRIPATPPAIRHQVDHPGPRSARPGGQQARRQVEPPGPRISRPPCSLPMDHDRTGSDPHGRRPAAGPRRRRPAAGPGTAQRTGPGQQRHGQRRERPGGAQRRGEPTNRLTSHP